MTEEVLVEFHEGKGMILSPNCHADAAEFIEVVSGQVEIVAGLKSYHVTSGDILHLVPGYAHFAIASEGAAKLRTLTYPIGKLLSSLDLLESSVYATYLSKSENWSTLFSVGNPLHAKLSLHLDNATEEFMGKDLFHKLLITAEIEQMVTDILRFYGYREDEGLDYRQTQRIYPALSYIQERYAERISLDDLSASLGISSGYFGRLFRETTGMTPVEYIQHIRVNRSMQFLLDSEESLAEISSRSGFASTKYFHRVFKALVGTSPIAFRKLRDLKAQA